ncbi:MAG TPA: single-stranded-DNA-specific exonuclease RecJ [Spongiibacteraceae bacterium]|nr:single-stranded-DNA-specific exonuclease RecJ [Spongiibacteraceae bacterium]
MAAEPVPAAQASLRDAAPASKQIVRRQVSLSGAAFSTDIPPLLQRVYAARGALCDDDIALDLKGLEPPARMKGIGDAAELLADAVMTGKRLLIVGDFDTDGATSTALSVLALRAMGARHVDFLVPNRFEYGYGLTPEIVAVAAARQPDLIITVDNGISSIDGVAAAADLGIPVLVTDHHLPGDALPAAAAIVNPNQPGCEFPSKALAGVGVMFYLLSALRGALRARNWFSDSGIEAPNLADYLDLVALGTVADVVPLDRNNRVLVEQGLRRIRAGRCRPGIRALLAVAGRNAKNLVSTDLGFVVGPRLNAAGRLDDMSHGILCLLSDDEAEALAMARELDHLNRDRRAIESGMQREAFAALEQLALDGDDMAWGLCLFRPGWHQGVVGLVASKVKERFHRPVIAFAEAEDGVLKGSARSIPGLHIRDVLDAVAARHPALLSKFGGHAMAAGMSLARDCLEDFARAFDREVRRQLSADDLTATLFSDGELDGSEFELALAEQLRIAAPWGQQFPEPLFDGRFRLITQRIVGERHLKMIVENAAGQKLDAIAFNVDTAQWPAPQVSAVHLAYKLDVNEFRGQRSVQLLVEHIAAV